MSAHELTVLWPLYYQFRERERKREEERNRHKRIAPMGGGF